jgi:hypothetical protein
MVNESFIQKAQQSFDFLLSHYDFKITRALSSAVRPHTDGAIEYSSETTVVTVSSETGYVTVMFYRIADGGDYYLTPVDVHEYLNTSEGEKELLLSTNPDDQREASSKFNEKFLLNRPGWENREGTAQALENELRNFAKWLSDHAALCIKGDFTHWPVMYEYKINRARADHLRRGKDELGYARVRAADGTWKLEKQSIFKDKLEHIEKLKKEFSERK